MKTLAYNKWRPSTAQEPRAARLRVVSSLHRPVLTDQDRADITARLHECAEQVAQRMERKAVANV